MFDFYSRRGEKIFDRGSADSHVRRAHVYAILREFSVCLSAVTGFAASPARFVAADDSSCARIYASTKWL